MSDREVSFSSPGELAAHYRAVRQRLQPTLPKAPAEASPVILSPVESAIHDECLRWKVSRADVVIARIHPCSRVVAARQKIMYRLMTELDLNFCRIGKALGGLSPMTVAQGLRSHCRRTGLPMPASHRPGRPRGRA